MRAALVVALAVVAVFYATRASADGDATEYVAMLESLWRHGSPDLRPEDLDVVRARLAEHAPHAVESLDARRGYFAAYDGRWYSFHFFAYPMLGLPLEALFRGIRVDPHWVLPFTNVVVLVLAAANALRGALRVERVALVALAAFGPVLWYVSWHHTEVLTWACVLTCLVALEEGRHARAAFFAAFGALQAPPLVVLAGLAVLFAFLDEARTRRRVLVAALAASVAGLAPAFYLWKFGVPSLHVSAAYTDVRLASADRVFSLFFDLNQGMLPHAPVTLVLGVVGLSRGLARRDRLTIGVFATTLVMMVLASQTIHFNAGCANVHRYVVWIIPAVAWLAVRGLRWRLPGAIALAPVTLGQLALVLAGSTTNNAYRHNPLARYVLLHAPSLYSPEPRVFVERTEQRITDPWRSLPLPSAVMGPRGATKVLLDHASAAALRDRFEVDERWLAGALASRAGGRRPFYLEPPAGAVMPKPAPATRGESWLAPEPLARVGTFGAGWAPGAGEIESRCASGPAEITIAPRGGSLLFGGWAPMSELGRPSRVRLFLDGELFERARVVHGIRRRIALDATPHVLRVEPEDDAELRGVGRVGFCVDLLRFE
ncbi:MAG: hypothetical protein KF819_07970 [Labilithrix sp.]|nr:hypothetical protein [Labilithrix sp.]